MERPEETCLAVLAQLRPTLERVFAAYHVSEQQAQEMVDRVCLILMSKRLNRQDPEGFLLRSVIEGCLALRKETFFEDPPE